MDADVNVEIGWDVPGWDWAGGDHAWLSSESGVYDHETKTSVFFIHGGRVENERRSASLSDSLRQIRLGR